MMLSFHLQRDDISLKEKLLCTSQVYCIKKKYANKKSDIDNVTTTYTQVSKCIHTNYI